MRRIRHSANAPRYSGALAISAGFVQLLAATAAITDRKICFMRQTVTQPSTSTRPGWYLFIVAILIICCGGYLLSRRPSAYPVGVAAVAVSGVDSVVFAARYPDFALILVVIVLLTVCTLIRELPHRTIAPR